MKTDLNAFEVIEYKGQHCMGGLMWRPLTAEKPRARAAEIRELADVFNATKIAWLQTANTQVVGLYHFQSMLPGERSPKKPYSLAASLAKLVPKGLNLVIAPTQVNMQEMYSLVVIEDGTPVIDTALSREMLEQAVAAYVDPDGVESNATIYCDERGLIPNSRVWPEEWRAALFGVGEKLQPVPVDYVKFGVISGAVATVALGVLFGYQHYSQKITLAKLQAASDQQAIQDYKRALSQQILQIGFDHQATVSLIDQLMNEPFVSKGWLLETIQCGQSNCRSRWRSEGGYTEEIISALPHHAPDINPQNTEQMHFNFPVLEKFKGVSSSSELPLKNEIAEMLFDEKQAWTKTGIQYQLDLAGETWPSGHGKIPKQIPVIRYPLEFSGEPALVLDFLKRYGQLAYYDQVTVEVNIANLDKAITIQVRGAFYGS